MSVDAVFKRFYKRRGVRIYNVNSDQSARQGMAGTLLPPIVLPPQETRKGFLFFDISPSLNEQWSRDGVLVLRNPAAGRNAAHMLELKLVHANP